MRRTARFPVYHPARDGNRFEWIIEQARILRERQEAAVLAPRPRVDYLTGRPMAPVVSVRCADECNPRSAGGTQRSHDGLPSPAAARKYGTGRA